MTIVAAKTHNGKTHDGKGSCGAGVSRCYGMAAALLWEIIDRDSVIRKTRAINDAGKRFLCENFNRLSVLTIPSETNFVTIDVKTDAIKVSEELMNRGVIVRPLNMYGLNTFLRVTIGTQEQNEKFIEAFEQVYES